MRYDKVVYFCSESKTFDTETGDYVKSGTIRDPKNASVMDTRTETLRLVYGEIRQDSYTIQLQNHYTNSFDYIEYDGKKYNVDFRRRLRNKETFIVSEVQ